MALLVGVNAGPLVTPWASLATLLWLQRCRTAGVVVPWRWLRPGVRGAGGGGRGRRPGHHRLTPRHAPARMPRGSSCVRSQLLRRHGI